MATKKDDKKDDKKTDAMNMRQELEDNADERKTYQNGIERPIRRRQGVEQSSTR